VSEGPKPHQGVVKPQRIADIAARQGGHVTRTQLYALGLSRRAVEHRLEQGVLIAAHRGVYAVGHLPTNPLDRARGALLAAGPRSALAHQTALAYWQGLKHWPEPLELISANDRRPTNLVVHYSSTLLHRDIRQVDGLRVTSPARTALDLAPRVSAKQRTRIVNDLRHQNRLTVEQLRDIADRNPRHPGARLIKDLIGDSQREPTRSELEDAFLRLLKKYKLPTPQVNVHVAGHRVDAYFPDHELVVELDGRLTHGNDWKPAFELDRARAVDVLLATNLPTIRFTWDQITRRARPTAIKLQAILKARQRLRRGA
jgi:very-short-patch-repair endonuclease